MHAGGLRFKAYPHWTNRKFYKPFSRLHFVSNGRKNKQHGTVNTIRVGHSAATWCTDDKIRSVSDLCKDSSVCNRLHRACIQITQREDTIMFTVYVGPTAHQLHKLPSEQTHSPSTCGKRNWALDESSRNKLVSCEHGRLPCSQHL